MNVLFIAQFPIYPVKGGVQRVTLTLAEEFENKGVKVFFLALREKTQATLAEDIRQSYLPNPSPFSSYENVRYFNNLIKDKQIAVLINQAGIYNHVVELFNNIDKAGAKLITVHHNCVECLNLRYREIILSNRSKQKLWEFLDKPLVWVILRRLNRIKYGRLFKRAIVSSDRLVLLSPQFIPELKYYGILATSKNKVLAIPNPASFEPAPSALTEKENRIIYVGRLCRTQKRVDRLLIIWEQLHQAFPDWHFDIVGDGSERAMMEKAAMEKQLDRLHFYGYTDPRPFLQKAKFFTMTSDFEGYGMVLVEAQAYGVVPIAFDCFSALRDIIKHEVTGLIINNFDINSYIIELSNLMKDESKRYYMAQIAQKSIKTFHVNKIAQQWIRLFKDLEA